jgi:signal transduction histidine kinase
MAETLHYLLPFIYLSAGVNIAIALAARFKTNNREYEALIFFWVAVFCTYGLIGSLLSEPRNVFYAFFLLFFPSFFLSRFLGDSLGISSPWKRYLPLHLGGILLSILLFDGAGLDTRAAIIPAYLTTVAPFWMPLHRTWIKPRQPVNWIEKCISLILVVSILRLAHFALFLADSAMSNLQLAVMLAQYHGISILLPLLINHKQQLRHQDREKVLQDVRQLNAEYQEEREVNELLIKTISHDLANPLMVIDSYLGLIKDDKIPLEEKEKILQRIRQNAQAGLGMIARIRRAVVTRNQAGLIHLESVKLGPSIDRMLEQFALPLQQKNLTLARPTTSDRIKVMADEKALIEHVLCNAMSNAIKFSQPGGTITLIKEELPTEIKLTFQDEGVGIRPERLEKKLLGPTPGTAGEEGSGLGLIIMGYFIRRFGGQLSISSNFTDGRPGTRITITLPKA